MYLYILQSSISYGGSKVCMQSLFSTLLKLKIVQESFQNQYIDFFRCQQNVISKKL